MSRKKISTLESTKLAIASRLGGMGDRIRQFRERLEMSQDQLARCVGVAKTTVFNAEKGYQKFNFKLLFGLVAHFDVNPDWLLFGEEKSVRPYGALTEVVSGHVVKQRPDAIEEVEDLKDGRGWVYLPVPPKKELVAALKRVEQILSGDSEVKRQALLKFLDMLEEAGAAESKGRKAR